MMVGHGEVYIQDNTMIFEKKIKGLEKQVEDSSRVIEEKIEGLKKQVEDLSRIVLIQGVVIGGIIGTLLAVWIFKII